MGVIYKAEDTTPRHLFAHSARAKGSVRTCGLYKIMYNSGRVEGILKPVVWIGNSRERVRTFPKPAREVIGFQLDRVQRGLEPRDWRPMPAVGPGAVEIRVHFGGAYRVFYAAKFTTAVYVLHAFVKKTRKTQAADIALGRRRYQELLRKEWE